MNPLKPIPAVLKDVKDENCRCQDLTRSEVNGGSLRERSSPGQFNMLGYPGIGEAPISFSASGERGYRAYDTGRRHGDAFYREDGKGRGDPDPRPVRQGLAHGSCAGKDLLLVAGGVGLAPLRPVIQEIIKNRSDFGEVSFCTEREMKRTCSSQDEYEAWRKPFHSR